MGMTLRTVDPRVEPREVMLTLVCDAVFCEGPTKPTNYQQVYYGRSFVEQYNLAMAEGWKEARAPMMAGTFYCPWCAGKKSGPK